MSLSIRRPWGVNRWNPLLDGIARHLLPPHGDRSCRSVLEYPRLHKFRLPQPRRPSQSPPSVRPSFGCQRLQTARTSALLPGSLNHHVAVTPHPPVLRYSPIPRHVLESVVSRTGLVLPASPVEDRLVRNRDRVKVIPEWRIGNSGRW